MPKIKSPRWLKHRSTQIKHAQSVTHYLLGVGARLGSDVRRPAWIAVRSAFRGASSSYVALQKSCGRPVKALRRRAGLKALTRTNAQVDDPGWRPGERRTLEVGSCIVLSVLGLGFEVGGWPAWSAPVAVGGYLSWVVLYSEITVQAGRRRAAGRRLAGAGRPSSSPEAPPA